MHEDFPSALKSKRIKGISMPDWCIKNIARYEKKRLTQVDAILFAEEYYKEHYLDIATKKEDVLNYPFLKEELDVSSKFELTTLVYAGAIHEIRGFKEMLEVARILKQRGHIFQLLIIGQVPEHLWEWSADFLEKNNMVHYVKLTGRMDLETLNQYYEKSDIGLALLHPEPNYLKSLPTKLFEYMSFGLPYVASDFPLWRKLMEDSGSGVPVDVRDVSKVADAIEILLNEQETYVKCMENGREAHVSQFNWQYEAKKLLQAYELLFERI
ncbi:glycosyltransferase [Listeria rocourtiae]|nr:glycosyltransferase [Listeria rocourtiae]